MNILQPAINCGLLEKDFWEMTVAEIERYVEGWTWRQKIQAQFDYNLSNLIGISVGRIIANDSSFPTLEEAYPGLFGDEQEADYPTEEERITEQSINNFLAFAQQHNARKKGLDNGN